MKQFTLCMNRLFLFLFVFCFMLTPVTESKPAITVKHLTCEYKSNPIGIDVLKPRLSWKIESTARDVSQTAYQLRVAENIRDLKKNPVWDSGKVTSDNSVFCVYDGPELQTGLRYYWQVKIWDNKNKATSWSEPAFWEMGLLTPSDWKADWIQPQLKEDVKKSSPSPVLRKEFSLKAKVKSARVYVTCLGLYEMELNGKRIGDEVLTP